MKILRFIYDWPPPWDGLGPGPFSLTNAQKKLGNQIVVLCGGGSLLFKPRQAAKIPGVKVVRMPRTLAGIGPFFTTDVALLPVYLYYRIFWRPDVIHGHGHITLWFNFYKFFFGWLDKIPYVLHFHNTAAGREAKVLERGGKIPLLTAFVEWPLHKLSDFMGCLVANKLFFVSEDTAKEAQEFYKADSSKVVVLENGVDTEVFSPVGVREKLFDTGRIIYYQGALTTRKRVDVLIKSLHFLSEDIKLAIVGPKNIQLEDLVKLESLGERVKFFGYIANNKTADFFRAADLFVLPSSYEGFPKVVLESLACGTPVLASGFSVSSNVSGMSLVEFETPEQLAGLIQRTLSELPKVNTEEIVRRFSWDTIALKIKKVYEELG